MIERETQHDEECANQKRENNVQPPLPYLTAGNRAAFALGNSVMPAMAPFEPVRRINMDKQGRGTKCAQVHGITA